MNGLLPIGPADSKRQLLEAATMLRRVVEFLPLCAVVPQRTCVPVFSSAAAAMIRNRCDPELLCSRNAVWPGSGVSVFRDSVSFQQFPAVQHVDTGRRQIVVGKFRADGMN
ncbi:hypothetical protein [Streptomyces kronopolitis]|uniref:hypothetical protein n=1 Tax=Streptomyces kronopolitis TaxID=1612435 RepID=UPI0036CD9EB7